jgi:putative membrane protein
VHRGDWDNDFGWWWLPMTLMMVLFWGVVVWAVVALIRSRPQPSADHPTEPAATAAARPTPQEILGERLARGEIDPDEYHQRLDAIEHRQK